MIGRVIGHYQIREVIGSGGMGTVYLAWDQRFEREVALKVLPPRSVANPFSGAVPREARAQSAPNHDAIARLYDFVSEPDGDCLVMELVRGESLDERITRGPCPEDEVVRLGIQLAGGLAAAHEAGVIHRDLKPANLRVTPEGRLKILDFGLARLDSAATFTTESVGTVAGTLPYIAPEVWAGGPATAAADLYATGVVLYELVTGVRPFADVAGLAVAQATIHRTPTPPSDRNPAVSRSLDAVILRCLEKAPQQRYASARALGEALEAVQAGRTPHTRPPRWIPAWPRDRRGAVFATASLVVLAVAILWGTTANRPVRTTEPSLAVLPFADLSPGAGHGYLAAGMTDELISRLGELPSLRVISRTSVTRYRDTDRSVPVIAAELGVVYLVEGTVSVHGNRIRVAVHLLDAPRDHQLWSHEYRGDSGDVLAIQGRLARSIAKEIGVKLDPAAKSRLAAADVDPAAYALYLQGRFHLDRRDADGIRRATDYFGSAVRRDSSFALAWTGLANAWSAAAFSGTTRPVEAFPRAKSAVLRALALDPDLSEAQTALGNILQNSEWDWEGAASAYRRAIELNENNAVAHHWYASNLALRGQFAPAMTEIALARELDPYSLPIAVAPGVFLYFARRHEEARVELERVFEIDSTSGVMWRAVAANYDRLGREKDVAHAVGRWLSAAHSPAFANHATGAYAAGGLPALLRVLIGGMEAKRAAGLYEPATHLAELHARLGEREAAFRWLKVALEERDTELNRLKVDPIFDPLRGDPRFDELLARVGFTGSVAAQTGGPR